MNELSAPDDADFRRSAHFRLHVVGEELADLLSRALVVDADEGGVVAVGDARVDRDDRDASLLGVADRRLDAIDVDGDEHDAVDLLSDIVLDGAVLRRRLIVGVEDDEFGAGLVRRLLRAVVDLIEEQRLLIDRDQRDRRRRRCG